MNDGGLHPIVAGVLARQVRLLWVVYLALLGLVVVVLAVALLLGGPEEGLLVAELEWLQVGLAGLSLVLLLLVVPLVRRRLMGLRRVRQADARTLAGWGLPAEVDPVMGRQAVYLTRYSACCVISWGTAAAVSLYGLVVYVLGGSLLFSLAFFGLSVAALAGCPPRRSVLVDRLNELGAQSDSAPAS